MNWRRLDMPEVRLPNAGTSNLPVSSAMTVSVFARGTDSPRPDLENSATQRLTEL
jgi:hypothetical protein